MPLVSLDQVSIAFGHQPLLEDVTLRLEPGERVCVIGRNGTGKSTLLKILAGALPPDRGVAHRERGVRTAMHQKDVPLPYAANLDVLDFDGIDNAFGGKPGFKKAEGGKPSGFKKSEGGDRPLKRIKRKTG